MLLAVVDAVLLPVGFGQIEVNQGLGFGHKTRQFGPVGVQSCGLGFQLGLQRLLLVVQVLGFLSQVLEAGHKGVVEPPLDQNLAAGLRPLTIRRSEVSKSEYEVFIVKSPC